MMNNKEQFERSELLVGSDAVNKLKNATVAVFGLGGVGGYAVEALARGGVGHLVLVDNDTVSVSNINRQIIATYNTVNEYKTQAWRERIFAINPNCIVDTYNVFVTQDNISDFDFANWNYCI
ncbi:MAG: ThiF family adenylyltransferase, partial [Oscillospiraceae bacterium]